MNALSFEDQLEFGRSKEMELRRHLAVKGHHVVLVNPDDENQSPKVHLGGLVIPAADLLCIAPDGKAFWVEVKAKSVPNFYYQGSKSRPGGFFCHGVDMRLWKCYAQLSERARLFFAVCEIESPPSDDFLPPNPPPNRDYKDYRKHLIAGPTWLYVEFSKTVPFYLELIESQKRARGARGKEMVSWPRDIMSKFEGLL